MRPALFFLLSVACGGGDKPQGDGVADGGADGGAADGGAADGGTEDGGTEDGGATDGGTSDGGATDGGAADGGAADGGAADGGGGDGGDPGPESTFVVDPEVQPARTVIDGFTDGATRAVGRVADDQGVTMDLVAGEVVVQTDDEDVLADLLSRWDGEVLHTVDLSDLGLASLHVVAVDLDRADPEGLPADLATVDPQGGFGDFRLSDDATLRTLAAIYAERASGLEVTFDALAVLDGYLERELTESSAGVGEYTDYSTNPYQWPSYASDSTQGIGIGDGWMLAEVRGITPVTVAVIDSAFDRGDELPADTEVVDSDGEPGMEGVRCDECCDGSCPWHGTNVASVLFSTHDDGYGAAGVATQVASPLLIDDRGASSSTVRALALAAGRGAKVANASFHTDVPGGMAEALATFDAVHTELFSRDVMVVASAGNDGVDLDGEVCDARGECRKTRWRYPCQAPGVLCVGGVAWDSLERSPWSAYGVDSVPLFAPFTLWVGEDPDTPGDVIQQKNGTSFSSPFAAGVAALLRALQPEAGIASVREALVTGATGSPDADVPGVVNVSGALAAFGPTYMYWGVLEEGEESLAMEVPDMLASQQADITMHSYTESFYDALPAVTLYGRTGEAYRSHTFYNSRFAWDTLELTDVGRLSEDYRLGEMVATSTIGGYRYLVLVELTDRPGYNEAGADLASATPVADGETVQGNVHPLEDGHYYAVTVPAGQTLTLDSTFEASDYWGTVYHVDVLDSAGATVVDGLALGAAYGEVTDSSAWTNDSAVDADVVLRLWCTGDAWYYELSDYAMTVSIGG